MSFVLRGDWQRSPDQACTKLATPGRAGRVTGCPPVSLAGISSFYRVTGELKKVHFSLCPPHWQGLWSKTSFENPVKPTRAVVEKRRGCACVSISDEMRYTCGPGYTRRWGFKCFYDNEKHHKASAKKHMEYSSCAATDQLTSIKKHFSIQQLFYLPNIHYIY